MSSGLVTIRPLCKWYVTLIGAYAPASDVCGTRPFLWWTRSQDRNPDASSSSKNTSGLVGIPLKKGRLKRQAINLPPGGQSPEARRISSVEAHPTGTVLNTAGRSVTQQLERCTNTMIGALPSDALVDVYLWRRASRLCREYNSK